MKRFHVQVAVGQLAAGILGAAKAESCRG